MSNDLPPSPDPTFRTSPQRPLMERLGLSGKLIAGGAIVGIISLFLPLVSVSVNMGAVADANPLAAAMMGGSTTTGGSSGAISGWRGVVSLIAYAAALVAVVMTYPLRDPQQRSLHWIPLAAGALTLIFALWLLYLVKDVGSTTALSGGMVKASLGFGGFLNLLAAGVVTYGGYLKAREEGVL